MVRNSRVVITVCESSPYNGKMGVIVGTQDNIDKHGVKTTIYLVRLDQPHRPCFDVVGFPSEAIKEICKKCA